MQYVTYSKYIIRKHTIAARVYRIIQKYYSITIKSSAKHYPSDHLNKIDRQCFFIKSRIKSLCVFKQTIQLLYQTKNI